MSSNLKNPNLVYSEIKLIDELLFIPCSLKITNCEPETESQDYFAHTFKLNNLIIKYRTAKITPTKIGQFVTLWKRNKLGITVPYSLSDNIDFYIIATQKDTKLGLFIFPKILLHQKGILSDECKDGKRGFRVYPIWDETTNKQAQQTQLWQTNYFLDLSQDTNIDLKKPKRLLTLE